MVDRLVKMFEVLDVLGFLLSKETLIYLHLVENHAFGKKLLRNYNNILLLVNLLEETTILIDRRLGFMRLIPHRASVASLRPI